MNTFKRKSLYAALGGLVAAGAAGTANAVYENHDGLGQALVYQYYTTRSNSDTLLTVVNSTASAKALKVRFLEGKNSREVLDFNLYLSAFDVWVAAVTASPTSGGTVIKSADVSCIQPAQLPSGGQEFRNYQYVVDEATLAAAAQDMSMDRTREGYFEILEMGTVLGGSAMESSVTHRDISGVWKPTCANLPTTSLPAGQLVAPQGGLFGSAAVVNVPAGADASYDAIALDQWSTSVQWTPPGSTSPTIAQANTVSTVINGLTAITSQWDPITGGRDAVSSVMMQSAIQNEYVIDPNLKAGTDWIVTSPTKRFYTRVGTGTAPALFQRNFSNAVANGSCDDIIINYWDREERTTGSVVDFSPPAPGAIGPALCWEVNVLTFNNSNVLGSKLSSNINPVPAGGGAPFPAGWARLTFPTAIQGAAAGVHTLTALSSTRVDLNTGTVLGTTTGAVYNGLPVIGMSVINYVNGAAGTPPVSQNYTIQFQHKGSRSIQ